MTGFHIPTEPRPKEGVWVALLGMLVFSFVLFCTLIDREGALLAFWCTLGTASWVVWAWGCRILIRSLPKGKERRRRAALLTFGLALFGVAFVASMVALP